MGKTIRLRNVCVTYNNPRGDFRTDLLQRKCSYYVLGKEIGESGTPHLQCYLEFNNPTSLSTIQKCFGANVHVERRKGTAKQAADYCKKDEDFIEFGNISHQGQRNDILELMDDIKGGVKKRVLYENHHAMWKYPRAASEYKLLIDRENNKFEPVEVIVLWGEAGTGKSRQAYAIDPELYQYPENGKIWFDGYDGQKTILFDDYEGDLPWAYFLKLLDGYKFNLPVKGGYVWKQWTRVIITSNHPPCDWYQKYPKSLHRRISKIHKFEVAV